jgi:hypothetical protein
VRINARGQTSGRNFFMDERSWIEINRGLYRPVAVRSGEEL